MASLSECGLVGLSVYFPRHCVDLEDLEAHDDVSSGRYTVGLGQKKMSFVADNEDVVSMALTVLQCLVDRYNIDFNDIGRLEVGTETIIDKSKSIKSSLMQLFEASGNSNVEGLDCVNACYGSTAALFNTLAWMESSAWDGRYGVVVATDISVYAPGPARPTGGAGAVAMLLGRGMECPVRFEVGLRSSHFGHSYDFYKPSVSSEYPAVNGQETVDCFVRSIDKCYTGYRAQIERVEGKRASFENDIDYFVCHAPFNKMVRRSVARLAYNDFMDGLVVDSRLCYDQVEQYRALVRGSSHEDRDATRAFVSLTAPLYESKCAPAAWLSRETGNMYTASLYSSLAALFHRQGSALVGTRILMFAFGSGFASSMFSLRVVGPVDRIVDSLWDLESRLEKRLVVPAKEYEATLQERELNYGRFDYSPTSSSDSLFPGTYHLTSVGKQGERSYERGPIVQPTVKRGS